MAQAVILAGGQGERFWPLTHRKFPKFRIRFGGNRSLLQRTYDRLLTVYDRKSIYVVTTQEQESMIREELPMLKALQVLCEPFRNNTAAAILFSCAWLEKKYGRHEIVSFFPADHWICDVALFQKTMRSSAALAKSRPLLVMVGVKPSFPATGYGYIQSGEPLDGMPNAFEVIRFVEKPNRRRAGAFVRRRNFLWNGGIFTWKIGVFLDAVRKFSPDYARHFDLRRLAGSYRRLPRLSIDRALLEKANNLAVYRTRMDWCDLGSWDRLLEKSMKDSQSNVVEGGSYSKESRGCLLVNHQGAPLVTLGVSGLIVVQTERGTLICRRGRSEEAARLAKKTD